MEIVLLTPGRIEKRMAQRAKYRLSEDSEWYYFQTRDLDNDRRINEYFKDEFFQEEIPTPQGVELKMYSTPEYYSVVVNNILEYHDKEYTMEHDGIVIFRWEKAIVLDFLEEYYKRDNRVTTTTKFSSEESDEMPGLV